MKIIISLWTKPVFHPWVEYVLLEEQNWSNHVYKQEVTFMLFTFFACRSQDVLSGEGRGIGKLQIKGGNVAQYGDTRVKSRKERELGTEDCRKFSPPPSLSLLFPRLPPPHNKGRSVLCYSQISHGRSKEDQRGCFDTTSQNEAQ